MDLFKLQATLGLDSKEYEKGLDQAEKSGSSFGDKLKSGLGTAGKVAAGAVAAVGAGAVALGTAFVDNIQKTAELGDEIDKTAQKMGLGYEEYQKLAYAAELSGANVSTLEKAQKQLMAAGSDLSITEALLQCADATDKTAMASELFGEKVAMELTPMLNSGTEGIQAMMQEAEDFGMVMSEDAVKNSAKFNDSLTKMKGTMSGLINGVMGDFLPAATEVVDGIALIFKGDASGAEMVSEGLNDVITKIVEGLPAFLNAGGEIITNLLDGILQQLPAIADAAVNLVTTLIDKLIELMPTILSAAGQVFMAIVQALPQIVQSLVQALPTIIQAVVKFFKENFPVLIQASIDIFMAIIEAIPTILVELVKAIPEIVDTIVETLLENLPELIIGAIKLLMGLIMAFPEIIKQLVLAAPKLVVAIVKGIMKGSSRMQEAGTNLLKGLWEGISGAASWLWDKVSGWLGDLWGGITDFFGIHSPSREMAWIGKMLTQGLADGIEDNAETAIDQALDMAEEISQAVSGDLNVGAQYGVSDVPNYVNLALGDLEAIAGGKNVSVVMELDKKVFGQVTFDAYNNQKFLIGEEALAI